MKLLVFHTGSLGDTLVAVPALWAIREHFREPRITILTDRQVGRPVVSSREVLEESGLVDEWLEYEVDSSNPLSPRRYLAMGKLLLTLRKKHFDALVYLIREDRDGIFQNRMKRDRAFFRAAGINRVIGDVRSSFSQDIDESTGLPIVLHQTDQLLRRLSYSGIKVPPQGHGRMDLNIGDKENENVDRWIDSLPVVEGSLWIAVGPGSKMPSKVWPIERYREVVGRLIHDYDVLPVVFGASSDRGLAEGLVSEWGRGYVAAGTLGVREGIAAMKRCCLYLGNDTGTMHMAVAAGIRCIAVFSARDYPGHWFPYGEGHVVFRTNPSCEGCMLEECVEHKNACLTAIGVDEVYDAAAGILKGMHEKQISCQ